MLEGSLNKSVIIEKKMYIVTQILRALSPLQQILTETGFDPHSEKLTSLVVRFGLCDIIMNPNLLHGCHMLQKFTHTNHSLIPRKCDVHT